MFVTLADVADSISDLNLAKKGEGKIQLWTLLKWKYYPTLVLILANSYNISQGCRLIPLRNGRK